VAETRLLWEDLTEGDEAVSKVPECPHLDVNFGEGLIEGKRCGTTQNIGPTARLRSLIYNPVKSEIA